MPDQINPEVVADTTPKDELADATIIPATFTENIIDDNSIPINENNDTPVISQDETIIPPNTVSAENKPVDNRPKGRGRHPKGCNCGNCLQSGGTGGYEKGGKSRPIPKNAAKENTTEKPDFSDVLNNASEAQATGADYAALASVTFDMTTGLLTTTFGDEWQPRSPQEKAMVCAPLANYMKMREMKDLPPGAILAFVCVAYAAPRFRAPSTREKIIAVWLWIKSKFGKKRI